jgi:hypothetical protein
MIEPSRPHFTLIPTPHIPVKKPKNPLRLVRWLGWVRFDTVFVEQFLDFGFEHGESLVLFPQMLGFALETMCFLS